MSRLISNISLSHCILVGVYLLAVYFMIAAGFWFHELENLSIDGELESDKLHDQTSIMYPQFGSNH